MPAEPFYLCWYDDSKKSPLDKLRSACEAYKTRYGIEPNVALLHAPIEGVGIRAEVKPFVRANDFWFSYDEGVNQ